MLFKSSRVIVGQDGGRFNVTPVTEPFEAYVSKTYTHFSQHRGIIRTFPLSSVARRNSRNKGTIIDFGRVAHAKAGVQCRRCAFGN
jgi:hypothetical protein